MPELEQLTLTTVNDINSIARFNRKLTYLRIYSVQNSLAAGLQFSKLKHLFIRFDCAPYILQVVRSSPKVETIEIRLASAQGEQNMQRCDEIITAALRQPMLKHL